MSLIEKLNQIPMLSFAEREEVATHALAVAPDLTAEENAILDERMRDFREAPDAGVTVSELEAMVREQLRGQ